MVQGGPIRPIGRSRRKTKGTAFPWANCDPPWWGRTLLWEFAYGAIMMVSGAWRRARRTIPEEGLRRVAFTSGWRRRHGARFSGDIRKTWLTGWGRTAVFEKWPLYVIRIYWRGTTLQGGSARHEIRTPPPSRKFLGGFFSPMIALLPRGWNIWRGSGGSVGEGSVWLKHRVCFAFGAVCCAWIRADTGGNGAGRAWPVSVCNVAPVDLSGRGARGSQWLIAMWELQGMGQYSNSRESRSSPAHVFTGDVSGAVSAGGRELYVVAGGGPVGAPRG